MSQDTQSPIPPTSTRNFGHISVIGMVLVLIATGIAVVISDPTPSQQTVFRTLLALGAAGFTAALPEYIKVDVKFKRSSIRASGALGVFLLVYSSIPAISPDSRVQSQEISPNNTHSVGWESVSEAPIGRNNDQDESENKLQKESPSPSRESDFGRPIVSQECTHFNNYKPRKDDCKINGFDTKPQDNQPVPNPDCESKRKKLKEAVENGNEDSIKHEVRVMKCANCTCN